MISGLLSGLIKGGMYVKNHPQIIFVLILLIVFPILFLYTGEQFLSVGRANQETLQKQRVGLMHDVFASLIRGTQGNTSVIGEELTSLANLNPDIIDYKILVYKEKDIVPVLAKDPAVVGVKEEFIDYYRNSAISTDESFIFETYADGGRAWQAYRAVDADGEMYFIYTLFSLKSIDTLFASREQAAYFSLIFVYCFIIALAFWHIKLTDYRYLYIAAKKANETKDLFTNMIAHELRAPLTAIKGYGSMLEEKTSGNEKEYAARVRESSERLIAIVNDLLDVARIQSGKLAVTLGEVDLAPVVSEVIDELRVSAEEKGIALAQNVTGSDFNVKADSTRLHQALINLVSNAIKYTPSGTITLSVEEKLGFVELRVKDTGMGISSEDQKKLFAPFFRVSSQDVSKITGTGLGMWITKQLIELMEGTIAVESIKGIGTHIVVTLDKPDQSI
jgi:two-component sensor histidine kinase